MGGLWRNLHYLKEEDHAWYVDNDFDMLPNFMSPLVLAFPHIDPVLVPLFLYAYELVSRGCAPGRHIFPDSLAIGQYLQHLRQ